VHDHRKVLFVVSAAMLLVAVSGCTVHTVQPQPVGPPPPPPTIVTAAPASLVISNASAEQIYYIHMSPSTDPSWGPDLLGQDTLPVGATFTSTGVSPGEWDVAVFDESGNCKIFMQEWFEANTQYTLDVDAYEWTDPYNCPVRY
jgi:hypothetical protein